MTQIKTWIDVTGQQWEFEEFLSDFEEGAILAMTGVFPGVGKYGCFFHVKQLGMMRKCSKDFDFKIRVKKLAALAFLPVADDIPVFESLATSFPSCPTLRRPGSVHLLEEEECRPS